MGVALAVGSGRAQTIPSIGSLQNENAGDLILGFYNPNSSKELVVDIGPASYYYSTANALGGENTTQGGAALTPGKTYNVAAYSPGDLNTALGASNALSSSTSWGVIGGNGLTGSGPGSEPAGSVWVSSSGMAFSAQLQNALLPSANRFEGVADNIGGQSNGGALASAVALAENSGDAESFETNMDQEELEPSTELLGNTGPLSSGGAATLELWELIPSNLNHTGGPATVDLGTLTLTTKGLTFTAANATPSTGSGSAGRIVNLSARADVGTGANILIAGFVLRGSGSEPVLLRAVGPTLGSEFSVSGALEDPQLTLLSGGGSILTSDVAWGGSTSLSEAFSQVGAFALPATSADSALLTTLAGGSYTSQVASVSGASGVALAEIYDAGSASSSTSLINISARAEVGSGADILIAGFVVQGKGSVQLLLRGVGPALGGFGVSGALASTSIGLYDSGGASIAANTGWGNPLQFGPSLGTASLRLATAADMQAAGAFPLPAASSDSAMVATVDPGSYTLQLSSGGGQPGVGLVEVYLLP